MPFRFQHFMDAFLEHLGPERTLAPSDFDRYFGKMLSKGLLKKLQDRPMSLEVWSPKAWSMALETSLQGEEIQKFNRLLEDTRLFLEQNENLALHLVKKDQAHLSWKFFGEGPETLLSSLSVAMKRMERLPLKNLESFAGAALEFQGLDFFPKKNNEGVLYLKPKGESAGVIREIEKELRKHLGCSGNASFTPHITLGRIKDMKKFERSLKAWMEERWNRETLVLLPDHFLLCRQLDHLKNQKVFGLVRQ